MNRRHTAKLNIIIWSIVLVLAVVIAALAIGFSNKGGFSSMFGNYSGDRSTFVVVKEQSFSEDINSVSLNWITGQVDVLKSEDNTIRIVQKASDDFPQEQLVSCNLQGNKLTVLDNRKRNALRFSIFTSVGNVTDLEVYLPEKQYKKITGDFTSCTVDAQALKAEELGFTTVSGGVRVSGEFNAMKVESTSGGIDISDSTAEESIIAASTSGKLKLSNCATNGVLSARSTSGKISGQSVAAGALNIDSVSGGVDIGGSFEAAVASSTSGGIRLSTSIPLIRADLSSVSGGVNLAMPENNGFTVKFNKVSGDFSSDFPVTKNDNSYVYKDGSADIKISTTSGGAHLNKSDK